MQGQLHQYKILKDLAKKYSHSTYLAAPIDELGRQVVLIVFSSLFFPFSDECEAVLKKAQALKKLQHPHLVPLLDMGVVDERPFVVREYVPNQSLRSYLKQLAPERLKLRNALTLLLQVGEALAYVHSHKIFHGNIKPENILLDAHGRALLTDFTFLGRGDVMVRDQTTEEYAFCYLAPEQFAGTWDAYSDQYAMGCLSYELITGGVPFATESLASLIRDQSYYVEPVPLSGKVPNLPASLEAAVFKALAKDPSDRFDDFSLFLEEIRAVASPPPAFPLLRSKASHQQKAHSRLARPRKPLAVLASPHKDAAPDHSLSQKVDTSSAINFAESESAGHFIDDIFGKEEAENALNTIKEGEKVETASTLVEKEEGAEIAFTLVKKEEGGKTTFMLMKKEEDAESVFSLASLENDEMTEALPTDSDTAKPMRKRVLANKRFLLGIIIIGLVIAIVAASDGFFSIETDKPVPSVDISTIAIQQDTSAGTQLSVPISSKMTLQPTLQATLQVTLPADTQPKTTMIPQSRPAPQSTPTPTPTPTSAKIAVIITSLGRFQCAQVLFGGQRLGNTVTVNDLQNNRNTITGAVTGAGMFSVDFYSTTDCSGTRGNYARTQTTTDATYACDGSKTTDLCTRQN